MFENYNFYSPLMEFESFLHKDKIIRVDKNKKVREVKLLKDESEYGYGVLLKHMSEDLYICGDLHIGDPIENWEARRDKIANTINNTVGVNDHLLILGDLIGHTNTADFYSLKVFIDMLKCKNLYLVLGNNDVYEIEAYKKLGFKMVTDKFIWKNYIFTHMPCETWKNQINIHGHIHEEIQYINVDWHNHINVWDRDCKPIKLKDAIERFNSGYYKGITINAGEELQEHEANKYFGNE